MDDLTREKRGTNKLMDKRKKHPKRHRGCLFCAFCRNQVPLILGVLHLFLFWVPSRRCVTCGRYFNDEDWIADGAGFMGVE